MSSLELIIQQIDSIKKELDALRPFDVARLSKVEQTFRLWWNYHSNAIEGNQLTLGETRLLLMQGLTAKGKPLKDHDDIKGHNNVVLLLDGIVSEERPINETLIRELHKALLREPYKVKAITPDGKETSKLIKLGEYKSTPNNVRTSTDEIHYYASPEETPAMMTELIDWYKSSVTEKMHPVLIAAYFHYKFVCIHPFDDGNGRMSRILMNLILIKNGYIPAILKIEDRNTSYITSLEEADSGNITPFIEYIINCELQSIQKYLKGIKGENIEELDDLDKKLKLFDSELESIGDDRKVEWYLSDDVIRNMYQDWIRNLLKIMVPVAQKFNKYYTNPQHYISMGSIFGSRAFSDKSVEEILKEIDVAFAEPKRWEDLRNNVIELNVNFQYGPFKKGGVNSFRCFFRFSIKFEYIKYEYFQDNFSEGNLVNNDPRFVRLLNKPMTKSEIETFAQELGDSLLKYTQFNVEKTKNV